MTNYKCYVCNEVKELVTGFTCAECRTKTATFKTSFAWWEKPKLNKEFEDVTYEIRLLRRLAKDRWGDNWKHHLAELMTAGRFDEYLKENP